LLSILILTLAMPGVLLAEPAPPGEAEASPSTPAESPGASQSAEEDEGNVIDDLLHADRQWLNTFGDVLRTLLIILLILLGCVGGIMIYLMARSGAAKNVQKRTSPARPAARNTPQKTQVMQVGDTLRIRRAVPPGQRPAQGQRPPQAQRPMQGQRPVQGQRPIQGQRPAPRPPQGQRPVQGQRPMQGQRPAPRPPQQRRQDEEQ
jgi:hypothetical protein